MVGATQAKPAEQLTPEELALLEVLLDPVAWAKAEYGWDARWYQAKIARCKDRKVVVRAGRRAGKTDTLATLALYHAYLQPNGRPGQSYRVLYVAPYESQVNEFFSRLREFINASQNIKLSVVRDVHNPHQEIELANGSLIRGMSAGSRSGRGAVNIRGQRADYLILDEADYLEARDITTLMALILEDPGRIKVIAASTPSGGDTHFRRWCLNKELGWTEFHYPTWVSPMWNKEMEAELREELTGEAYRLEVGAEFGEQEFGVFQKQFLDLAVGLGKELGVAYIAPTAPRRGPRVLGVDWDKYSSGSTLLAVEFDIERGLYIPIYREEIPRSQFTLGNAKDRIIKLDQLYHFDYIYVDRGFGERQVEELHQYGLQHPHSGLHEKVKGVAFQEKIKVRDPHTRQFVKKPLKHWMVNNAVVAFEKGQVALPPDDAALLRQLRNYRVVGRTSAGYYKFTDQDEHIVDAFCLALHGLLTHFTDLCKVRVGRAIYPVSNHPGKKEIPGITRKPVLQAVSSALAVPIRRGLTGGRWGRGLSRALRR